MRYTPTPKKINAVLITVLLLVSSLSLIGFSLIWGELASKIFKMTSIVFFAAALLVTARYLTFSYTYTADDDGLVITKNTKNSHTHVCRLYYQDITTIEKTLEFSKKKDREYTFFHNYCTTLFCKNSYTLSYNIGGDCGIIVFEPDVYFVNYLEKYIKNDIILP